MSTRKRLYLAFITLSITLVVAIGIVVGVYAALNQSVANDFTIMYEARNVSARISAYRYTAETARVNFTTESGERYIVFDPQDSSEIKTLSTTDVELTSSDRYIVMVYKFENTASAGGRTMTVTLSADNMNSTNMNRWFLCSSNDNVGYQTIKNTGFSSYNAITPKTFSVQPQSAMYYYQLIEVADITKSAEITDNNEIGFLLSTN